MNSLLKKIPEQIKRLSVIIILVVPLFIIGRNMFVPEDFGELGHYRTSAIDEIIKSEIHYAGQTACYDCHEEIFEDKMNGFHKNLSCEVCHGPSAKHTEDPENNIPIAPRLRQYCVLCHEYLPSRPTGFPQIIASSHNPVKPCIKCHEAHNPKPPQTPKDCAACHATIARSKSVSSHAYIACTTCHETDERHKTKPRDYLPTLPSDRAFCGQCHSVETENEELIPRIEMSSHEVRYVCWQCHYPHYPEAN